MKLTLYTDGASRGNPGNAAIAYSIMDGNKVLEENGEFIGVTTNNEAEYKALIKGLSEARKYKPEEVTCISDSQLLIKQVRGEWKINKAQLKDYSADVKRLEKEYKKVTYKNVPREDVNITRCDALANKALDER